MHAFSIFEVKLKINGRTVKITSIFKLYREANNLQSTLVAQEFRSELSNILFDFSVLYLSLFAAFFFFKYNSNRIR